MGALPAENFPDLSVLNSKENRKHSDPAYRFEPVCRIIFIKWNICTGLLAEIVILGFHQFAKGFS